MFGNQRAISTAQTSNTNFKQFESVEGRPITSGAMSNRWAGVWSVGWTSGKRAARWFRSGITRGSVIAMALGLGGGGAFVVAMNGRLPTGADAWGFFVGTSVWYLGWSAGRVAELLRIRRAAAGTTAHEYVTADAKHHAAFLVWRDERHLSDQLYTPAKLLLSLRTTDDGLTLGRTVPPTETITERFALSQLAAAVLFYERARAATEAVYGDLAARLDPPPPPTGT
jgi:hypothetical protein